MRLHLKQHSLLGLLFEQHLKAVNENGKEVIGVSFEKICNFLDCNKDQLHLITAKLFDEKEVGLYRVSSIEGLYLAKKGFTALSTKKYLKEASKYRIDLIKDYLNITVSTIAIITAIITTVISLMSLIKNRKEISGLHKEIDSLKSEKRFAPQTRIYPDSPVVKQK
jgi:hypothetical protein